MKAGGTGAFYRGLSFPVPKHLAVDFFTGLPETKNTGRPEVRPKEGVSGTGLFSATAPQGEGPRARQLLSLFRCATARGLYTSGRRKAAGRSNIFQMIFQKGLYGFPNRFRIRQHNAETGALQRPLRIFPDTGRN